MHSRVRTRAGCDCACADGAARPDARGSHRRRSPAPIGVRAPNDGSGRLFVISQAGTIRIVEARHAAADAVPDRSGHLSGFRRHERPARPRVPSELRPVGAPHNDEFYVVYDAPPGNCTAAGHLPRQRTRRSLERYTVRRIRTSRTPAGTVVMRLADNSPPSYHNGGDIHFGPDGYLYMSSGDGGQESGTHWLAECLWKKPNDTTSDELRQHDTTPAVFPARQDAAHRRRQRAARRRPGDVRHRRPASWPNIRFRRRNPYVGSSQTCDETFLYGFRNPWRWSFDRANGDMWIADVGQDAARGNRRAPRPVRASRRSTAGIAWKARSVSDQPKSARRRCRPSVAD